MDKDRQRILGLLVAFVVLVGASVFVMDWFVADLGGVGARIAIDLRSASVCTPGNPCVSVSLAQIKGGGFYPMLASITYFGTILFALIVVFQAGSRILTGYANPTLTRIGMLGGVSLLGSTVFAAYIFGPDPSGAKAVMMLMMVERTFAPVMLLVGLSAGILALHYAAIELVDDSGAEYKPIGPLSARAAAPADPAPARAESAPAPVPAATTSAPLPMFPEHLKKQLRFVVISAEVTRGGIDARREDGSTVLVMWRDVVGVVARRLPAEHDGATFVDLVSVAGRTLRILPWTRLTGDAVAGTDEARARALVALVVERCPEVTLDPATAAFLRDGKPAAQLPDAIKLAQHDDRLA